MPQISQLMEVYASQFFWLLIVIGIIYFAIGKGMLPKISKTVENRQKRITDDLAAAQAAQDRAEQVEEDYRNQINDARGNAVDTVAQAKQNAVTKNEKALARADSTIAKAADAADAALKSAKESALTEIETVAVEATRDIVATISGGKVTVAAAKKAVKAAF